MARYNELRPIHAPSFVHGLANKEARKLSVLSVSYANVLAKTVAETGSESFEAMILRKRKALQIVRGLRCTHTSEERLLEKVLLGELQ